MSVSSEEKLAASAREVAQRHGYGLVREGRESKALRLAGVIGGAAGLSALGGWLLVKTGVIGAAYNYVVSVSGESGGNRPMYVALNILVPLAIGATIAAVIALIEKTTGVEIKGGGH